MLQSQLRAIDDEIPKHQAEQRRLNKQIAVYQAKLEAIPVREQEVTALVQGLRDFEGSLQPTSRQRAFRRDGDAVGDPPEGGEVLHTRSGATCARGLRSPTAALINTAGSVFGLGLGLLLALVTDFLGVSITSPQQITEAFGLPVLEVIPVIHTFTDQRTRKKRLMWADGLVRAGYRTGVVCDSDLSLSGVVGLRRMICIRDSMA